MPDDQTEVIEFLSAPQTYDGRGLVQRIDTHCSLVFMAGDRVYKLKRAVSYSYLDYSTLALRRRACEREVELNRRTAPSLYIGVRAIKRRMSGTLGFDGEGAVLDWVVVMARFDQENLFDRMAASGRLSAALMRELADVILAFHRDAKTRPDHGGMGPIAETIEENDKNLRIASPALDPQGITDLRQESEAALAGFAELLEMRRRGGKVRQCHGDLHLRNICLVGGRPTLFDGIEFNDEFACIDVLYDLAFLLMDLRYRQHGALGAIVFNRYLDNSDEIDGLPALPLFLSLRAGIRAHVTAASAAKQSSSATGEALLDEARAYLALARHFLLPAAPRLIAIGGLSGSGKSTLAYDIASDVAPAPGARVIRTDVVRKRLTRQPLERRLPASAYTAEMRERVYAAAFEEARKTLAAGYTVIVDATFLDPDERRGIEAVPRRPGVPFIGLWLDAPPEILRARIAGRQGDASDADIAVLSQQLGGDPGPIEWRRIDVSGDPTSCLTLMREALSGE